MAGKRFAQVRLAKVRVAETRVAETRFARIRVAKTLLIDHCFDGMQAFFLTGLIRLPTMEVSTVVWREVLCPLICF
jgi:hypothetical protein